MVELDVKIKELENNNFEFRIIAKGTLDDIKQGILHFLKEDKEK